MMRRILWAFFIGICFQFHAAAEVIRGKVTDEAGRPIRGAIVKAAAGNKAISRYTQDDGRYEIRIPAGTYDISATAYGYRLKHQSKDATQSNEANFLLSSGVDVMSLSGADLETFLPDNREASLIKQECIACHVSFPELTPYGRYFKLTGYSIGKPFAGTNRDSMLPGTPSQTTATPRSRSTLATARAGNTCPPVPPAMMSTGPPFAAAPFIAYRPACASRRRASCI